MTTQAHIYRGLLLALLLFTALVPFTAKAQTITIDENLSRVYIEKAVVTKIISETQRELAGTNGKIKTYQNLEARVLSGPDAGKVVTVDNSYLTLEVGEKFYL